MPGLGGVVLLWTGCCGGIKGDEDWGRRGRGQQGRREGHMRRRGGKQDQGCWSRALLTRRKVECRGSDALERQSASAGRLGSRGSGVRRRGRGPLFIGSLLGK